MSNGERRVGTDAEQLREPVPVLPGRRNLFQLQDNTVTLHIDLDPDDATVCRHVYTLHSTDDAATYTRSLTVKDDQVPGDEYATLRFEDLDPQLAYTLEVTEGGSDTPPTAIFSELAFETLKEAELDVTVLDDAEGEGEGDGGGADGEDFDITEEEAELTEEQVEEAWNRLLEQEPVGAPEETESSSGEDAPAAPEIGF